METSRTLEAPLPDPTGEATLPTTVSVDAGPRATLTEVHPGMRRLVGDAVRHADLLPKLGSRFLTKFTFGTKLGRSWLLIRPLMNSIGMALLFGGVLKVGAPGQVPYYLFLMSGLLAWRLFERSLRYGTRSFSVYRKMMMTFHFPLLLVPIASLAYPLLEITVYWLVFFGALIFFWLHDGTFWLQTSPELLYVIPAMALLLVITIGMMLWTSVLNAKARDTRLVLRYAMQMWLFVTPVIYPVSKLPESIRWIATVNPMTAPVEMMKKGLLGTSEVETAALIWSLSFAALIMLSGLWYFNREAARSIDALSGGMDDEDDEMGP